MDIEISFPGGARVDASFGDHVVKTDQPVLGGGQGSAPAPFALFLASIGTCAGIYILRFCQQRALPTDDIRIRQSVVYDSESGMVSEVNLDIILPSDFPTKYARALVHTANLCAVKKTLDNPPVFNVEAHVEQA